MKLKILLPIYGFLFMCNTLYVELKNDVIYLYYIKPKMDQVQVQPPPQPVVSPAEKPVDHNRKRKRGDDAPKIDIYDVNSRKLFNVY